MEAPLHVDESSGGDAVLLLDLCATDAQQYGDAIRVDSLIEDRRDVVEAEPELAQRDDPMQALQLRWITCLSSLAVHSVRVKYRFTGPPTSAVTGTLHLMVKNTPLPGPCTLCGGVRGQRLNGSWHCVACGWRYGDVPDADLPLPRIDVVYYLRFDRRVKIGTSMRPRQRLASIRHDELLAFERGGRTVEQQRHRQFSHLREGGEWFTFNRELEAHISVLRAEGEPWHLHARWLSEALRA